MHDHSSLGDGTINICADDSGNGFLYSKEKITNAIWTKGTNLETFIAYNCNIRANTNSNGTVYTYLLGSEIPDSSKLVYYYLTSSWEGGGACEFYYKGVNGTYTDNRSNSVGAFDWDGSVSYSKTEYWSSGKSRCEPNSEITVRAWSKHNNTKQIICYPFG